MNIKNIAEEHGPLDAQSHEELLNSGNLVDVSKVAAKAGIPYPFFLARDIWDIFISPYKNSKQNEKCSSGRLWLILWMFRRTVIKSGLPSGGFRVPVYHDKNRKSSITFQYIIGPDNDGNIVVNIMLKNKNVDY